MLHLTARSHCTTFNLNGTEQRQYFSIFTKSENARETITTKDNYVMHTNKMSFFPSKVGQSALNVLTDRSRARVE